MLEILRLVRIRTIAFAAFTMYAMRYFVVLPMLELNGFAIQMPGWEFTLLVVAICCLISGAYVINDYFDTKTDRISGVKNIVVGRSISRRMAIILHSVLNVVAVAIAFYLGIRLGEWEIGLLFLLVSVVLWFYSSTYKKRFLIGNVLVGLLAALIPVSAIIYEIPLLNRAYAEPTGSDFVYMFYWIFGFSWFIFLNTLMYEINKDIYTLEGDRENGNRTIPVRLGIQATQRTLTGLAIVAIVSAVAIYFVEFASSREVLIYLLAGIVLPYVLYIVAVNSRKPRRRRQLTWIRAIMVLCIGLSVLLKHFFQLIFTD